MVFGKWQWAQSNKNPFDFTEWDIWSYTTIPFMWHFLSSYSEDPGGILKGS